MRSSLSCNQEMRSLVNVLRTRAELEGNLTAFTYLPSGDEHEETLTFAGLYQNACVVAAALAERFVPGERALLLYPSGLDFMSAFFGCLLSGVIPVALYPPGTGIRQARRALLRMIPIVESSAPSLAMTTEQMLPGIKQHLPDLHQLDNLTWIASDKIETEACTEPGTKIDPQNVAFLQYTSGSTSQPKGVIVTHENLMYNERMIYTAVGTSSESVCVSWLPVFHDMGLIGCMLHSVYAGIPCIFMPAIQFIKRPVRWLKAITRYAGTYSGAPNFAFDLCTRKITSDQRETLDLSSWELAFNSSEPVQADTLDRFYENFSEVGFRRSAFYPAYGLAEATVMVSGGLKDTAPATRCFDGSQLANGRAEPACKGAEATRLVGVGSTVLNQEIAIVNPDTHDRLGDGLVGEIWVSGVNVSRGYWGDTSLSESAFGARMTGHPGQSWLRTGDLGFMIDGELFISGRIKELIIVAGRNFYPQDIELTVEQCHTAIRSGCVAAFSTSNNSDVVVMAEARLRSDTDEEVRATIQRAVASQHEIRLADICLLKPASLPKTTSGKIRRLACRDQYEAGELNS